MQVLIDYQIFEIQKYGGISRYFYEISKNLIKNNSINLNILAGIHINQYIDSTDRFCIGLKKTNHSKLNRISHGINELTTRNWIKYKKPDIIHETYYYRNTTKKHNQKIVITIHDMVYEKFPHYFSDAKQTCLQKKSAIDRADQIICVSENTKKDVIDIYNIPEEKISVIYHGRPASFLPYSLEKKSLFDNPYLLYVGQRGGYKNFLNLLTAFSNSKTLKNNFDLVCFGGGEFNSEELLAIKKQNLSNKHIIQLEGNDKLLNDIYTNAQAFIYPSLYEGFGIPILESISNACPVICSNTSCFPEVAGDAAHYFEPNDPDSIKNAIEDIVFSKERSNKLILAGNEKLKEYSWQKSANSTFTVYQNVL